VAIGPYPRSLDEFDVLVRDKRAVDILHKVKTAGESPFEELVSGDTPFGLATNFSDYVRDVEPENSQARLYANIGTKRVQGAVARAIITKNSNLIDVWKLFLPKTGSGRERERSGVDLVLGPPIIGEPGSVCTQTYLVAGPFGSKVETEYVEAYLRTRLARFLVSLRKPSQDVFSAMYRWVPVQTWDRTWIDADLYKKYGITQEEVAFIESMIRPMGESNE
jgi:site-specific DNA-methyltransferase (adenine-specific)